MIALCDEYSFPVRIIDADGIEVYANSEHTDEKKTIVVSIAE